MHRLIALLFPLLLVACAGPGGVYRDTSVPISSAAAFDPARYEGLWYEIARFPVPFQTGCVAVTAEYALRPDGSFSVLNSCRQDGLDGKLRQISGRAVPDGPGRLRVSFRGVPLLRAPYWVLWVDEGYTTAVVGTPSGRSGWILSRTPRAQSDKLRAALEVLDFNGYDVSQIQPTPQPR